MQVTPCCVQFCEKPAIWRPIFSLYTGGVPPGSAPTAQGFLSVGICEPHRGTLQVKDFMNPHLWRGLVTEYHKLVKSEPNPDNVRLTFQEFDPERPLH